MKVIADLFKYDGCGLVELIKAREVTAREVVEASINRIEKLDPNINSVVSTRFDQALQTSLKGSPKTLLSGVPLVVKDLLDYKGLPNTGGSRFYKKRIAKRTADPITAIQRAGAVVLGKSNTPEFGLKPTTEPELFGPCRNPWNLGYSAGGSSGGAAAAVAAGLVPMAHATDGGGSIRMPASLCGLFGLKPSAGRVYQSAADNPHPFVMQLCISRSVRDTAAFLSATEDTTSKAPFKPIGLVKTPSAHRRRIGVHTTSFSGAKPSPDVCNAVELAIHRCQELGHEVVEASPPLESESFWRFFKILWGAYPSERVREAEAAGVNPEDVFEPWTISLAEHFLSQTQEARSAAVEYVNKVKIDIARWFDDFDIMMCPVLSEKALPLNAYGADRPFDELWGRLENFMPYTAQHNAAGTPAMSVPTYYSPDGFPIGVQFAAGIGNEKMLLELAFELEAAFPWRDRWPPFAFR